MGHIRLGPLPTSKKWHEVVDLLVGNASLEEIALAAARAVEFDLNRASDDSAFQYVAKLLVKLPLIARMPSSDAGYFDAAVTANSSFF